MCSIFISSNQFISSAQFGLCDFYQGLVRFEDQGFPSIRELLDYHVKNQVPVTRNCQVILATPVKKDKWEICREGIVFQEKKPGRGHFGDFMEGVLKPSNTPVAVKSWKESVCQVDKKTFLAEAEILKRYDHPNIVRLIGVCTEKEPVFIGNFFFYANTLLTDRDSRIQFTVLQ